jgi:hypothetical protein
MNKDNKTGVPRADPNYLKEYLRKNPDKLRKRNEYRKLYMVGWLKRHPKYRAELDRRTRCEIFNLLGNKCSNPNCLIIDGCQDIRCLQIDHVNNDGYKYKSKLRKDSRKYYCDILRAIKAGSNNYQLLCANCNWIKRYENKSHENRVKFIS